MDTCGMWYHGLVVVGKASGFLGLLVGGRFGLLVLGPVASGVGCSGGRRPVVVWHEAIVLCVAVISTEGFRIT